MKPNLPQTFSELGIDLKGKQSGQVKTQCPKCSADRKNKKDPCLSVTFTSPFEGVWNCHHCGYKGSLGGVKEQKKEYKVPEYINNPLPEKRMEWFRQRGISKSTLLRFKIGMSDKLSPKTGQAYQVLSFPYFRNDEVVNIKHRFDFTKDGKPCKSFMMEEGAELIFYNLDSLKESSLCYIVEGEIDCLTMYEAWPSVACVSVPNGASSGSSKLEYLDHCWQYFEDKTQIVIATDGDGPGLALRDELARRLGKERCFFLRYPEGCKDLNEVLVKHGKDVVQQVTESVCAFPIEGITEVGDINEEINNIYNNGYPTGDTVGFEQFDQHLSFRRGELTTVTGIPNSGKSEFVDELLHRLASKRGWRIGIFSAENPPVLHFAKIAERHVGKRLHSTNSSYKMTEADLWQAKQFVANHYYFVSTKDITITLDYLLNKAKELVMQKGISAFLIDPWNYIDHARPNNLTETEYISQAYTKIANAAKSLDIHIFVVAHPTKLQKDKQTKKYEIPTLYSISGSAHFYNKTDNGITVYRHFDTNLVDVHIQKVRFKFIGKVGMVTFEYDWKTGRYNELPA